jgi:hypothetical protein
MLARRYGDCMSPDVVIAGIYSEPDTDPEPPQSDHEYVVVVNVGDEPVDLRGWSLTNRKQDQVHHFRYLFPRFLSNGDPWELAPGGMVFLHTGRGTNGGTATTGESHQYHLYQHRGTRIWVEPGDVACLHNREGQLVSSLETPGVGRTA